MNTESLHGDCVIPALLAGGRKLIVEPGCVGAVAVRVTHALSHLNFTVISITGIHFDLMDLFVAGKAQWVTKEGDHHIPAIIFGEVSSDQIKLENCGPGDDLIVVVRNNSSVAQEFVAFFRGSFVGSHPSDEKKVDAQLGT